MDGSKNRRMRTERASLSNSFSTGRNVDMGVFLFESILRVNSVVDFVSLTC